jgi:hypothetical protein
VYSVGIATIGRGRMEAGIAAVCRVAAVLGMIFFGWMSQSCWRATSEEEGASGVN